MNYRSNELHLSIVAGENDPAQNREHEAYASQNSYSILANGNKQ